MNTQRLDLRCLTVHQPFASALIDGHKHFETRSWRTDYSGLVALHASRIKRGSLPCQAILGVVKILRCVPCSSLEPSDNERALGNWTSGFAWEIDVLAKFADPISVGGAQRLWMPRPSLRKQILEALEIAQNLDAVKTQLRGFAIDRPAVVRARILSTLTRVIRVNGRHMARVQFVKTYVFDEGYRVKTVRGERRFTSPSEGSYFAEKDISKTAMDFADFLGTEVDS